MNRTASARSDVTLRNQTELLNLLRRQGELSRVDIAARMKLTKAAVTNLTNGMLHAGMLVERGEILPDPQHHPRGRRKILLGINENYRLAFGITINAGSLRVGLTNLKGGVLSRAAVPTEGFGYRDLLEAIVAQIDQLIKDNCITSDKLLGVGICLSEGAAPLVEGENMPAKLTRLKKDLSHALTLPIVTTTTCIGALAAEVLFADARAEDLLLCRYGREVGCAVLLQGQICRGASHRAGGFAKLVEQRADLAFGALWEEPETQSGTHAALNAALADLLSTCAAVIDPERVAVFGDYFETEQAIEAIRTLAEERPDRVRIEPAVVTEATVFLAGCASVIAECLYQVG